MNWLSRKKEIPVLAPLEAYNRWASSYHVESNPIKEMSDQLVEQWIPDNLMDKSFLDAGCGVGKFCNLALAHNASHVMGLDISPAMIEIAKRQCPSASFLCGDLSDALHTEGAFDCILCALVLGHIDDLATALNTLLAKVNVGGIIIITDFHPYLTLQNAKRTFKDPQSGTTFEVRHHLHLFQEYFKILRQNKTAVIEFEEPSYNGTPVVFGIVAQKLA